MARHGLQLGAGLLASIAPADPTVSEPEAAVAANPVPEHETQVHAPSVPEPANPDTAPSEVQSTRPPRAAPRQAAGRQRPSRSTTVGEAKAPFYAGGRPIQTGMALDPDLVALLEELSRARAGSINALLVAAVHAGLPPSPAQPARAILDERVQRAGTREMRVQSNLRLPEQLRARLAELHEGVRDELPRSDRADLINAALRTGLPTDPQKAADLTIDHARRRELASLS